MPVSDLHDGPLEMIRTRPEFLTELLLMRGLPAPRHDLLALGPTDITDPLSRFRIRLPCPPDPQDEHDRGPGKRGRKRRKPKRKRTYTGPREGFIDGVWVYSIAVDKLTEQELSEFRVAWEADFDGDLESEAIQGGRLITLAVIVESQLRRRGRKRGAWLEYVSAVRKRLKCPVLLLIITPSQTTAKWAARPIRIAHSREHSLLHPEVIGPDQVPVILDPDQARATPELTILSGWMHARGHTAPDHFTAFFVALDAIDDEHADLYADVLRKGLRKHTKRIFEQRFQEVPMLVPYVSRSKASRNYRRAREKLRAEARVEGRVEGEAESLLTILDTRNLDADAAVKERIAACDNPETLQSWIRRAITATSTAQIFT